MSDLLSAGPPRSVYWGPAKVSVSQAEEIIGQSRPDRPERVVVKRLWWKLWRRCRVRQMLRRTSNERGIRGSVSWGWVDVEVLPDLPEARAR